MNWYIVPDHCPLGRIAAAAFGTCPQLAAAYLIHIAGPPNGDLGLLEVGRREAENEHYVRLFDVVEGATGHRRDEGQQNQKKEGPDWNAFLAADEVSMQNRVRNFTRAYFPGGGITPRFLKKQASPVSAIPRTIAAA